MFLDVVAAADGDGGELDGGGADKVDLCGDGEGEKVDEVAVDEESGHQKAEADEDNPENPPLVAFVGVEAVPESHYRQLTRILKQLRLHWKTLCLPTSTVSTLFLRHALHLALTLRHFSFPENTLST